MKEIKISGMMCQNCVKRVAKSLKKLDLDSVKVSLEDQKAYVSGKATIKEIEEAIENAGYEVVK